MTGVNTAAEGPDVLQHPDAVLPHELFLPAFEAPAFRDPGTASAVRGVRWRRLIHGKCRVPDEVHLLTPTTHRGPGTLVEHTFRAS